MQGGRDPTYRDVTKLQRSSPLQRAAGQVTGGLPSAQEPPIRDVPIQSAIGYPHLEGPRFRRFGC